MVRKKKTSPVNYFNPQMIESPSQDELESLAKTRHDEGNFFLAYDLAKRGAEFFPKSLKLKQVMASSMIRTGAIKEAKKILESLLPTDYFIKESRAFQVKCKHQGLDEETIGLLGRVYKDIWKQSGRKQDARRCRDTYQKGFSLTSGYWTGINVATMSWLIGDKALSCDYAKQVLDICETQYRREKQIGERFWISVTKGEAQLLLGKIDEAIQAYRNAAELAGKNYQWIVSALQQLLLLKKHNFKLPDDLFDIFKPPTVVVFTGHMIDQADRPEMRFPSRLAKQVREEIDHCLDEIDARVGYCSAAAGADILFIEAMLARNAEVNIILPFSKNDFLNTSVSYAGKGWVRRFHKALNGATSVKYVTKEGFLGDEVLFDFTGHISSGYGYLKARTLESAPCLLAVWDGKKNNRKGGTGDIVSRWPDQKRHNIIPINKMLGNTVNSKVQFVISKNEQDVLASQSNDPRFDSHKPLEREIKQSCKRYIKTLLFADVVGFSKMGEELVPVFIYEFLEKIASHLHNQAVKPLYINTWGDAIFAVMNKALSMAEYALALQQAVLQEDWISLGFPHGLNIRIALHAGPVFTGRDPLTGRSNFYGSHINRTARLEPVTIPGYIYASEQFAALLTMEQMTIKKKTERADQMYHPVVVCEYVGDLLLAKGYDRQPAYQIRRNNTQL